MTSADTYTSQEPYRIRFEHGLDGLRALSSECTVAIVVDVLSFSTSVDVAVGAGARVLPLRRHDERAQQAADRAGAVLAGRRSTSAWSLSPSSLRSLTSGVLLGLPSPNGATLCAEAAELGMTVFAGCLRNATSVAGAAARASDGAPVGVLAAGERWTAHDGGLRPAIEDVLGAGAAVSALRKHVDTCSPEAELAAMTYRAASHRVGAMLADCASGRELSALGFAHDVRLAADADSSTAVPRLRDGAFGPDSAERAGEEGRSGALD